MNAPSDLEETERKDNLRSVYSFVAALGLLAAAAGVAAWMFVSRPSTAQKNDERAIPTVDTEPVLLGSHTVELTSEGVVRSAREVALAAGIGGKIITISPSLIEGGTVDEGDLLATIDDSDYRAALSRAQSAVAEAQLEIQQEAARGQQAQRDWHKLGRGQAPALVLRKPQIAAAEARLAAALAEVERAANDVARTRITAPFAGRIRKVHIEVGAYVNPGSPIADLFSDRRVEVRLPFSLADYALSLGERTPPFEISADFGGETRTWKAVLDRTEGEIDRETLSGFAIARIEPDKKGHLPPVGLFMRAVLTGRTIENAVEIPRAALRGMHDVWVLNDGKLAKRQVRLLRAGKESLIVSGDFQKGDSLVTTRLSAPVPGMELKERKPAEADN